MFTSAWAVYLVSAKALKWILSHYKLCTYFRAKLIIGTHMLFSSICRYYRIINEGNVCEREKSIHENQREIKFIQHDKCVKFSSFSLKLILASIFFCQKKMFYEIPEKFLYEFLNLHIVQVISLLIYVSKYSGAQNWWFFELWWSEHKNRTIQTKLDSCIENFHDFFATQMSFRKIENIQKKIFEFYDSVSKTALFK